MSSLRRMKKAKAMSARTMKARLKRVRLTRQHQKMIETVSARVPRSNPK